MNDIKESVKIVLSVATHQEKLNSFAKNEFNLKFKDVDKHSSSGGFMYYKDFTIKSESQIQVNYCYGAGDMDFESSFIVDIK